MKENGLTLKKPRNRQYPTETITDEANTNDQALLQNIPVQAECLLHSLEQAARIIDQYMNSNKTEFICFKEYGAISTLKG